MASIKVNFKANSAGMNSLSQALQANALEVVDLIHKIVSNACPVRTGFMKSTIQTSTNPKGMGVYVEAPYASYTEYRTSWFSDAIYESLMEVQYLWQSQA